MRQIAVRVRWSPDDSAVADVLRNGEPYWSLEAHLLDENRMMVQASIPHEKGKKAPPIEPHPQRPGAKKKAKARTDPNHVRKLNAARARKKDRDRKIASGEIT